MRAKEKLIRDGLARVIPTEELRREEAPENVLNLLNSKLDEEIAELRASGYTSAEEFGDVVEVLMAHATRRGILWSDVEAARLTKLASRGGFNDGLVWSCDNKRSP